MRRQDLDGLRGIAIALVAMFHVWFGRVSGGVDVFLVLSGFFFGGRVLRAALSCGRVSPAAEIPRLVRRLLPALVVVLAATAVLTVAIQPQTRWETFAEESLASLGYFQNWQLALTASDYLRAGEAVSPLQHIWSMSVQGQFYLAFLALIWAFTGAFGAVLGRHLRVALVILVSTLTVASFGYAVVAHRANQSIAYYNSLARAWELLVGVLVGAIVGHVRWPMWLRTALASVGLAAICCCGALIDGVKEFPGPAALVPVGATVLIILAGANQAAPAPNRLLAAAPLVALGAMAYSLYLWHWPLLIVWLAYSGHKNAGFVDGAAVLLVSALLAYLTTRHVENPLRYPPAPALRWRRPTTVLAAMVALLAVTLTATAFTWREYVTVQRANGKELARLSAHDYPGARALTDHLRVPKLPMRPTVLEAKKDLPETTVQGCISDFTDAALINCTYGDRSAARTIALAGGSHAEHWITALALLGRLHHFRVVTYLKMGCPLSTEAVPLIPGNLPYPQCHDWVDTVMGKLVADKPDWVFTNSTRPSTAAHGDSTPASYLGIWQRLSDNGIGILGIRDTPWMVTDRGPFEPADCLANGGNPTSCGMKRSDALADHNPTLDYLAAFPLLRPLDMTEAVCRKDVCRAVEGNVLVYHDSHHLSATYVRTMATELGRQIAAATGWW